jgi:hypothetical protein
MPDAFDGADKPFKGASYRALILILLAVIVGVILVWLGASWGLEILNQDPPGGPFLQDLDSRLTSQLG